MPPFTAYEPTRRSPSAPISRIVAGMKPFLALLLVALPANAAAETRVPFCADLDRLIATMRGPGSRVPSLAVFGSCRVDRQGFSSVISCSLRLPNAHAATEPLVAATLQCFPDARRLPDTGRNVDEVAFEVQGMIVSYRQDRADIYVTVSVPEG